MVQYCTCMSCARCDFVYACVRVQTDISLSMYRFMHNMCAYNNGAPACICTYNRTYVSCVGRVCTNYSVYRIPNDQYKCFLWHGIRKDIVLVNC